MRVRRGPATVTGNPISHREWSHCSESSEWEGKMGRKRQEPGDLPSAGLKTFVEGGMSHYDDSA